MSSVDIGHIHMYIGRALYRKAPSFPPTDKVRGTYMYVLSILAVAHVESLEHNIIIQWYVSMYVCIHWSLIIL